MQQKPSTRGRIIDAARLLFSERGFHRTAMADLAEHAKVSVGTIYRSFDSKSAIVRAIVEADTLDTLERLRSNIDKVRDGEITGATAIEQLITEWGCTEHDALGHEIVAEAHRNPEIAEIICEISGQFRESFRVLARIIGPKMDEAEVEGVSEILLACLFGMGNRDFTQPHLCEQATAAVVAKLILRSVQTYPSE